jgi:membrane protease YdiL (CAAX protease family)
MNPFDEPNISPILPLPAESLPWGWAELFKATLLIVLGSLALFVITGIVAAALGLDASSLAGMSSPLLFTLGSAIYALMLLAVYLFAVRRPNSSWQRLGIRPVAAGWWAALLLLFPLELVGMVGINLLLVPLITGTQFQNPQSEVILGGGNLHTVDLFLLLVLLAVVTPVAEELFFRGMLYPVMRKQWGVAWAIILNALVFALLHFIPILIPGLLLLGLILAWMRERSGSIVPGILLHAAQNALVVIALYSSLGQQTP